MQDSPNGFDTPMLGLPNAAWLRQLKDVVEKPGHFQPLGRQHCAALIEDKPVLLVTFETIDGIQSRADTGQPLGWELVRELGWSHLCILSNGDTWFRDPAVYAYFDKLKADPSLIPNMVSEIIRYQTPLGHMRRNALEDIEIGGKQIKKGDKVIMWYISGNRDETVIEDPDRFWIDRPNARRHLSFGFGVHRCMGNRVGEMQLRILWEEILNRFDRVELVGEPERVLSNFVMGYTNVPVIVRPKAG